jgi:hypothetical protein
MQIAGIPAQLLTKAAVGYGVLVNAGAAGLFYYDKQQAIKACFLSLSSLSPLS